MNHIVSGHYASINYASDSDHGLVSNLTNILYVYLLVHRICQRKSLKNSKKPIAKSTNEQHGTGLTNVSQNCFISDSLMKYITELFHIQLSDAVYKVEPYRQLQD